MKKTISIVTFAAVTAATAAGAITAAGMELRPRKDVIEPTIMTIAAAGINAVNPEMFAAADTTVGITALPHNLSQEEMNTFNQGAADNQSTDFLGGTRSSYTTQHSAGEANRQTSKQADYTGTRKNIRKNSSYNPERNARTPDGNGSVLGQADANHGYTGDSRYRHNRMSDYGNYMHNQHLHGGYGNPFEGRTDCRTYMLKGDVYIVIPELSSSSLDILGTEYRGTGLHHSGQHTGVPDRSRTPVYSSTKPNNTSPNHTRTDGTPDSRTNLSPNSTVTKTHA